MRLIILVLSILFTCYSCSPPIDKRDPADKLLAQVGSSKLYSSQLEGMVTEEMSSRDSIMFISTFVERWTREQVMLSEAEKNLPADVDLNALVEDYRRSLLRLNYEEVILKSKLDSIISEEELEAFYEANKDQYQLEKPIIRCLFMKIPTPVPTEVEIQKLWNRSKPEDIVSMRDYASQYAENYLLSDSTWYTLEEIGELIPSDIVNSKNINGNTDWTLKAKNFKYYLKVLEMKSRKDIAPLSFILEQASRAVLHRRKLKILDDWREEIYQKALRENQVNIFTN